MGSFALVKVLWHGRSPHRPGYQKPLAPHNREAPSMHCSPGSPQLGVPSAAYAEAGTATARPTTAAATTS
ncbi:hypothetical protein V2A60_000695 [Cordyceps javanica]